jgi:hypothetical protein
MNQNESKREKVQKKPLPIISVTMIVETVFSFRFDKNYKVKLNFVKKNESK